MIYKTETCKSVQQLSIRTILEQLPQWFGIPSALDEYVKESENLTLISAYDTTNMIGFVSLKPTSETTLEVYVMGILPMHHRQGIGKELIKQAIVYAQTHGMHYLQVKTLSPTVKDTGYLSTYAFYKANGFEDVEVLPLWDEWNPCLMMIQKV
ncbi:GNAT family N-acetyltransferase [Amedibacillus sp. YH-ame10]